MNSIWNNNFSAFQNRFPQLIKMLSEQNPFFSYKANPFSIENPPDFWTLQNAKNGELTAIENSSKKYLHSSYNPTREASSLIQNKELNEKSTTIFFGIGLGYHIVEWSKAFSSSDKKLVIIEPDLNHLIAAMCYTDLTSVFKIQKLVIAVSCPEEQIIHLIEDSNKINVENSGVTDSFIFENQSFVSHAEQYFKNVKAIIQRNKRKNEINAATLKKFGKLWCKNSLNNIHYLSELDYISSLKKAELPFLIIGAGPTLSQSLPYLHQLKNKMIIVCVETALHSLLKINLQPDFIILTDPQYWAYRHIAALKSPESYLITEVTAYPAVFRFNCKKILLCASQFPVGQYFEKKLNFNLGDLGTGGSVICSAWNFAYFYGAKKIYTAGMDMGFPENQTHIKGSSFEQTIHTVSTKLKSAEQFTSSSICNANAQEAKNYSGKKIITDSRMKMFAWWLEARLAACPDSKTYSLSSQSLFIPGISAINPKELLTLPDIQNKEMYLQLNNTKNNSKQASELSEQINELLKTFPQNEFLEEFPFLSEYL